MKWSSASAATAAAAAVALALGTLYASHSGRPCHNLHSQPRAPPPAKDVTQLIGNTPLVRLNYLSAITNCEIWAKLELANPGGSAKDRVALAVVNSAEESGLLRPGCNDAVFEGTSGSTGISIALVCRAKGYEAHIVVPDDTSADKLALLRSLGAFIHEVRPASIADRKHYVNVARSLAEKVTSDPADSRQAVFANQFENEVNWKIHNSTTGPEVAEQCPGIDCFITGSGTGGTISGVACFLKNPGFGVYWWRRLWYRILWRKPKPLVVLADVPGSGLYNKIHYGVMFNNTEREGHRRRHQVDTVVEGIGLNRITANLAAGLNDIDDCERVEDADARYMASLLVNHEGLFVGSSSAVNCVAAYRQARKLGPGKQIVTVLCDSGTRHLSKFWAMPLDESCELAKELMA